MEDEKQEPVSSTDKLRELERTRSTVIAVYEAMRRRRDFGSEADFAALRPFVDALREALGGCPVCLGEGTRDAPESLFDMTCALCGWHYTSAETRKARGLKPREKGAG